VLTLAHGGSARSWAAVRLLLGGYLAVHFAHLVPWAGETFVAMGTAAASPLFPWVPSPLWLALHPTVATFMALVGTVLAVLLALGIRDRPVSMGLLWILACFLAANPLILNPGLPHVGWMLLAVAMVPAAPSLAVCWRGVTSWRLPPEVFAAGWVVMALAYGYSGWTKLDAPSWVDGSALWYVLQNPLARPTFLREVLLAHPGFLTVLTWGMLGLELMAPLLALSRRSRPWLWAGLLALHVGALLTLDFADLTGGLIVLAAWTFDPAWLEVPGPAAGARSRYNVARPSSTVTVHAPGSTRIRRKSFGCGCVRTAGSSSAASDQPTTARSSNATRPAPRSRGI
jgi:hypothetical protein